MNRKTIQSYIQEISYHLEHELIPFWIPRCLDKNNGGYITHFDQQGNDTGEDIKSLISQTRMLYTLSSLERSGYGSGKYLPHANHGIHFLIDHMWDSEYGGFYWATNRKGMVIDNKKILYGQSFAIYALCEYTLASGDPIGLNYAERVFELIQKHATDTYYGGYYEMFEQKWQLRGPGSQGGDRKTLDVHMHLMEAFTTLVEAKPEETYKRKLEEVIQLLELRMLHPTYKTGIPQFTRSWEVAHQIKFDTIWGWDRFKDGDKKSNPQDNTAAGHNAELIWLLLHAVEILQQPKSSYAPLVKTVLDHVNQHGIDPEYGGVYVEGPHSGGVYDQEKEFWQQAEVMIGMLEGYLLLNDFSYLKGYDLVHRFVFDKVIFHEVGEWLPLLTREGKPIWTHMGHAWKINYHTVRSMIQCKKRLEQILKEKGRSLGP